MFIAKSTEAKGLPFEEVPTTETLQAMNEADQIAINSNHKHWQGQDLDNFFSELREN